MINKIGILTFWDFPEGMAPTTRVLAYSKGLVKNGVDVEIYSFRRIFKSDYLAESIEMKGDIQGVKYAYIHVFSDLGKNLKLIRIIDEFILRLKLILMVLGSHWTKPFNLFMFSFDDVHSLGTYCRLFKIFTFPKYFVADEFPIPIRDFMKESVPADLMARYTNFQRFFRGRILMSNALKDFYNRNSFELPTFILNTIVDSDRFQKFQIISGPDYICYMGNMSLKKDNVDNIIKAFSLIAHKYPFLQLHLYGLPNEEDKQILTSLIGRLNLEDRVFIKGKIANSSVPSVLKSAKVCVNSQPITKRAEGGFPTKLGEYLLAGVPSLFTDSGDISVFVKNAEHTFLAKPENPADYAEKLDLILSNYSEALKVAEQGRVFIARNFSAEVQTAQLLNFFNQN
ncbi:MAG: glycosyltransferase family 4 protein [Bacteroidia bacterium]|nr:glycosyltransferase family 4 protein [Bacteroidia bacterium]